MVRIRTLGRSEIDVGGERIGAEQPTAFTLVFLLAMRAPRPMSRRELASILWPNVGDADRNHRLRSLLHRVRRLGVPLDSSASSVALVDASVDFRELARPPRSLDDIRQR